MQSFALLLRPYGRFPVGVTFCVAPAFLWAPPCGAGSFLFAQKGTKNALGAASGERLRAAGAHSHCPQTPIYGGGSLWSGYPFRRAKFEWTVRRFPAHWGLLPSKVICQPLYHAPPCACLLVRCGGGRMSPQLPSPPGSARVGGVCTAQSSIKFCTNRGQCPRGKKGKPLKFCPPDESAKFQVGRPLVKRGTGGKATWDTAAGVVSLWSRPPAILW